MKGCEQRSKSLIETKPTTKKKIQKTNINRHN